MLPVVTDIHHVAWSAGAAAAAAAAAWCIV